MLSESKFNKIISMFDKIAPVLIIGDIGVDKYTKGEVKRISPEAPVPVVEVFEEWTKLGLATNVSDNLHSLNVGSTICGVIGDDNNGDILENLLEERSLSTWGVVRCKERMTTFKERIVTDVQQVCRIDYETSHKLKEQTLLRLMSRVSEFVETHSAVIIEDYGKGLFCEKSLKKIIELAKKHQKFIAVDPSRITDPLFYRGVDLLKPNKVEGELMARSLGYREKDISKISKILIDKLELKQTIITLGSEGMAITDINEKNGETQIIPTVAREVFDVSGAGDTAISAIVASLTSGATLEEAAWIGNCASGVVVAKKGTALVNQEELSKFFFSLKL